MDKSESKRNSESVIDYTEIVMKKSIQNETIFLIADATTLKNSNTIEALRLDSKGYQTFYRTF